MRRSLYARLAVLVLLGVVATSCGSQGTQGVARTINGAGVAQAIASQVTDTSGNPISPNCPDKRLAKGDTLTCHVTFSDGSFHDVAVTVTGFSADGTPQIKIDVG
jgi:hypothetical protein